MNLCTLTGKFKLRSIGLVVNRNFRRLKRLGGWLSLILRFGILSVWLVRGRGL